MAESPTTFNAHVAAILAAANNLQQILLIKGKDLRGAQRKYLADHVLMTIQRQLVSFHNIALRGLVEANGEEVSSPTIAAPKKIVAPSKYKKNINPKSVRSLNAIIKAANSVQTAIHNATTFYIEEAPFIPNSQKSAASRAIVEIVRNIRTGREQLSPSVTPEEKTDVKESLFAIDNYLTLNEAKHDERDYLAIVQRAEGL